MNKCTSMNAKKSEKLRHYSRRVLNNSGSRSVNVAFFCEIASKSRIFSGLATDNVQANVDELQSRFLPPFPSLLPFPFTLKYHEISDPPVKQTRAPRRYDGTISGSSSGKGSPLPLSAFAPRRASGGQHGCAFCLSFYLCFYLNPAAYRQVQVIIPDNWYEFDSLLMRIAQGPSARAYAYISAILITDDRSYRAEAAADVKNEPSIRRVCRK